MGASLIAAAPCTHSLNTLHVAFRYHPAGGIVLAHYHCFPHMLRTHTLAHTVSHQHTLADASESGASGAQNAIIQ